MFDATENCAAYLLKVNTILFSESELVGKSCELNGKILVSNDRNSLNITHSLPVKTLLSGNDGQDEQAHSLLQGEAHPTITFHAPFYPLDQFRESLANGGGSFKGLLNIGGMDYPITGEFTVVALPESQGDYRFNVKIVNKLSYFKIQPPTFGWGIYSPVNDYIELHSQFDTSQIENYSEMEELLIQK